MKENHIESHCEKRILQSCTQIMQEMLDEFIEWYDFVHGENAFENLDEEEKFAYHTSYFQLVQKLFLQGTTHSGGTSTMAKCEELGVDSGESLVFTPTDY